MEPRREKKLDAWNKFCKDEEKRVTQRRSDGWARQRSSAAHISIVLLRRNKWERSEFQKRQSVGGVFSFPRQ